jgi:HSP20 family protein
MEVEYMAEEKKELTEEIRKIIPPVDIYETQNEVFLVADIPGVSKENLKLDIDNDELTIRGMIEEKSDGGEKFLNECLYGEYHRTFTLGDTIDREKITAKLENGVLTLTLPKHERLKPRKIAIGTE